MNKIVFTCGDINGIGPEIVIKCLNKIYKRKNLRFFFICPENIFEEISEKIIPEFSYQIVNKFSLTSADVTVVSTGLYRYEPGKPTKDSGKAAFRAIKLSHKLAAENKVDAIVTAPISKTAIKKAGVKYPGHTEMYADWCGAEDFVMMFLSKKMNAALATIHQPIRKVPNLISINNLRKKIEVIKKTLSEDLNIKEPRVAILGLNPHAGENGLIGTEEKKFLEPVIKKDKSLFGPFSPDAFFANKLYRNYNMVLGMYHDQVLIPFKMLNFSEGVNYTAGLPIIRTSPDHGTAFDIARSFSASPKSMLAAFYYAEKIIKNRKLHEKRNNR
jgi:4-hydroxythreonine-4-phosphate dehydrogenase